MTQKTIGSLFVVIGCLHILVGMPFGFPVLKAIAMDGFVNAIGMELSRQAILWFNIVGILVIAIGLQIRESQILSRGFVWTLILLAVVGCILLPISGFWLLFGAAILLLRTQRART